MKRMFSIILCTCNRPEPLKEALLSICALKTDAAFEHEVLVIDNNRDASLRSTVESLANRFGGRLFYHHEPRKGKSYALNHGIEKARGDILAFTDDDVIVDENWLLRLNTKFDQYHCDGIGGRVLPVYPQGTSQWVKDNAVKIAGGVVIYDYGQADFLLEQSHYAFIGANFAFKRDLFKECGGFRTDMGPGTPFVGEDSDLVERFLKAGKKLYYSGDVLIWHPVDPKRLALSHLAKWNISLGRYAAVKEIENKVKISSYFCGVPRYLWKGAVVDLCSMLVGVFDRMAFRNAWRAFFRKVGMIRQYRSKVKH